MSLTIPFTPEQKEAMNHEHGNLQIIACAGSGKTEVVSGKVAKLISKGHPPESIVAFTFTEKAAAELSVRIRKSVEREDPGNKSLGNMYVGTIHGFCLNLLKEFQPKFQNYDPLDERTRISFLTKTRIYKHLELEHLGITRKYDTIKQFTRNVDALREESKTFAHLPASPFKESMSRYEDLIEEQKVLDFTSMLYFTVSMLENDAKILKKVREKYKFVIVDEYQDVNAIQERLIRFLCGKNGNLTVVGDDDQAIYQWRGTDVANMLTFDERYSKVKQVKLEANYRSTKVIVENANDMIHHNPTRLAKKMFSSNKNLEVENGDCYMLHFDSADGEADWIIGKINSLLGTKFIEKDGTERPLTLSDFAILVRSVKEPSKYLIPRLRRANLDFIIKGNAGLFARPEIALVMECMSYVSDLQFATDSVPGIEDLKAFYLNAFPNKRNRIEKFAKMMKEVKNGGWDDGQFHPSVLQIVYQEILNAIGLEDEEFSELSMFQLGKFSTVITDFERFNSMTQIKYMKYFFGFARGFAQGAYEEGAEDDILMEEALTISSVHGVKGLEFPVVFMPYLIDNFFPTTQLGKHAKWLFDPDVLDNSAKYDSNIEDERRLFYVAITRAKKFLFLTHSTKVHTQRPGTPSRFLQELDKTTMVTKNVPDPTKRKKMSEKLVKPLKLFPTNYSQLRYYMACPYDYKMRYVYRFNSQLVTQLGYGQQVHNALNQIHKRFKDSGKMDLKTAKEIVDQHFFLRYAGGEMARNLKKGVMKTAANYVKKYGDDLKLVLESEKPFEFSIDEILISGTIDLIKREEEKKPDVIEVIDFKTEKQKVNGEVPFDTQMQLTLYAVASKESLGYNPKRALVHNLDSNNRTEVKLSDAVMSDAKDRVRNIVKTIRSKKFPMAPDIGRECENCDWNRICIKNIQKSKTVAS